MSPIRYGNEAFAHLFFDHAHNIVDTQEGKIDLP